VACVVRAAPLKPSVSQLLYVDETTSHTHSLLSICADAYRGWFLPKIKTVGLFYFEG